MPEKHFNTVSSPIGSISNTKCIIIRVVRKLPEMIQYHPKCSDHPQPPLMNTWAPADSVRISAQKLTFKELVNKQAHLLPTAVSTAILGQFRLLSTYFFHYWKWLLEWQWQKIILLAGCSYSRLIPLTSKIQQCKIKWWKKIKSTQLKIVGGFLPYELGGMVEEGNESSQKAGCRCLTLFCPAQIQPRVAKEHLTALHQMRDLVPAPLSFAWCIPPAGRDKGPGTSQCSTELLCTQTASDWLLLEMQWD